MDVLSGSEALVGTRSTALGGGAALPLISSETLGKSLTLSEPVFLSGKWD